jgi:hypothetical protein
MLKILTSSKKTSTKHQHSCSQVNSDCVEAGQLKTVTVLIQQVISRIDITINQSTTKGNLHATKRSQLLPEILLEREDHYNFQQEMNLIAKKPGCVELETGLKMLYGKKA